MTFLVDIIAFSIDVTGTVRCTNAWWSFYNYWLLKWHTSTSATSERAEIYWKYYHAHHTHVRERSNIIWHFRGKGVCSNRQSAVI